MALGFLVLVYFMKIQRAQSGLVHQVAYSGNKNTVLDCDHVAPSYQNVTWSFNDIPVSNISVKGAEQCGQRSGPFQVISDQRKLVICNMDITQHQGNYTCEAVEKTNTKSRTINLQILGEYIEVSSGTCNKRVSVGECEKLAKQVYQLENLLIASAGPYPLGCYHVTKGNRFIVAFNLNEDKRATDCTSIRICICLHETKPPRPIITPPNITVPYKSESRINCKAECRPFAQITWYRLNQDLNSSTMVKSAQETTNDLIVKWDYNASHEHPILRNYMCEASNKFGIEEEYITVRMANPPSNQVHVNRTIPEVTLFSPTQEAVDEKMKIVIGLSCFLGAFVIVAAVFAVKKWYERRHAFAPHLSPDDNFQLDLTKSVQEQAADLPYNLHWEFPRLDINLTRIIGEGNFGEVWEAQAEGIAAFHPNDESELAIKSKLANLHCRESGNDYWVKYFRKQLYPIKYSVEGKVAIKCLKDTASEDDYIDLASELKLMIHIGSHQHIVNLLGACTLKGPLWLILEYCPHGDLQKYLRKRELVPGWETDEEIADLHLCFVDLLRMSMEIADGMIFLNQMEIVHRDLAARNILVGAHKEMKIADFGLARNVEGVNQEYNKESETAVPVRWLAPESMQFGTYTSCTDIWSYGILMWEIFAMGKRPYAGMSNHEVFTFLEKGERMEAPQHCPDNLYLIMRNCWNIDPKQRPTFHEVLDMLVEVRRLVFAPDSEYYAGSTSDYLALDDAEVIDCSDIIREKRIQWLLKAGWEVTEDNVDRLLMQHWGYLPNEKEGSSSSDVPVNDTPDENLEDQGQAKFDVEREHSKGEMGLVNEGMQSV